MLKFIQDKIDNFIRLFKYAIGKGQKFDQDQSYMDATKIKVDGDAKAHRESIQQNKN